jgi:hypothetical protein
MDPALLGARLVRSCQTGAPLDLAPAGDNAALGTDPQRSNNFDISRDQGERRCPFGAQPSGRPHASGNGRRPAAHHAPADPFGREVSPEGEAAHTTHQERGLMFVCYQTSILNQFEFLQTSWANDAGLAFGSNISTARP